MSNEVLRHRRIIMHDKGGSTDRVWAMPPVSPVGVAHAGTTAVSKKQQSDEQAYLEGFEKGRHDGRAELEAAIQGEVENMRAIIVPLIDAAEFELSKLEDSTVEILANLALSIARQLVSRELQQDPAEIIHIVREALAALPQTDSPHIHLHPEDASLVRNNFTMLAGEGHDPQMVIDDVSLMRGDCKIISKLSHVDATLDARFKAVIAEMIGGGRKTDALSHHNIDVEDA